MLCTGYQMLVMEDRASGSGFKVAVVENHGRGNGWQITGS